MLECSKVSSYKGLLLKYSFHAVQTAMHALTDALEVVLLRDTSLEGELLGILMCVSHSFYELVENTTYSHVEITLPTLEHAVSFSLWLGRRQRSPFSHLEISYTGHYSNSPLVEDCLTVGFRSAASNPGRQVEVVGFSSRAGNTMNLAPMTNTKAFSRLEVLELQLIGPCNLAHLSSLRQLTVTRPASSQWGQWTSISALRGIQQLTKLNSLVVMGPPMNTRGFLSPLPAATGMTQLKLCETPLTTSMVRSIAGMTGLVRLWLSETDSSYSGRANSKEMVRMLRCLKKLTTLYCVNQSYNRSISDLFGSLPQQLRTLTLSLPNCKVVKSSISTMAGHLPALEELSLDYIAFNDGHLKEMVEKMSSLERLEMTSTDISPISLHALAQRSNVTSLRYLDISQSSGFTAADEESARKLLKRTRGWNPGSAPWSMRGTVDSDAVVDGGEEPNVEEPSADARPGLCVIC